MRTLGVDLAAQPEKTAACSVTWSSGEATIDSLSVGLTDNDLSLLGRNADKIGLDVPFGWPTKFVQLVANHFQALKCEEFPTLELRFRATDLHVKEVTGKWPLSVSTDRIGVPAFRAIRLLHQLTPEFEIDRSGAGKVVEVYPAGGLIQWGFLKTGKKEFSQLGKAFLSHVSPWLQIPPDFRTLLLQNRDGFDALIACLIARAAAVGLCVPIPSHFVEIAKSEGWIALPTKRSLASLPATTSIPRMWVDGRA